ncbi:MAG TPA: hypothetical protein EYP36_04215 [Calditrichaeota bacterium]|nr:hypothetical protein [Calditrichota bacterium]
MRTKKVHKLRKSTRKRFLAFSVLFVFIFILSLRMYQGFRIDLLMKELPQLEEKKKNLLHVTEKLRSEVERLKNIDRITRIAREKLGLVLNEDKISLLRLKDYDEFIAIKKDFGKKKKREQKYQVAGVQ